MVLRIDHRDGSPPATADVLGRWAVPRGRDALVAVLAPGGFVVCWWPRRPRSRRVLHWYRDRVLPELHRAISGRWDLAGASLHVFAPSAATATAWAVALAAAEREALH